MSVRHLHRLLSAEVGAGPLALARARRAHAARVLLATTDLPVTSVAFASGFSSVRQFNDTVRSVFGEAPSALRPSAGGRPRAPVHDAASLPGTTTVVLRLATRPPFEGRSAVEFLAARAVPGVEEVTACGHYRRSLRLAGGAAIVEAEPAADHVVARFHLTDLGDLASAVRRVRQLFDLDADPAAVGEVLATGALAPLASTSPGRRAPGAVDGDELAVRAVLGQQVSLAAARTSAARLVAAAGEPLAFPLGAVTHLFPTAAAIAAAADVPGVVTGPASRRRALVALAEALASGRVVLDPGSDRQEARARLSALPGIGAWTAGYVTMRALGDTDVFLSTDLGVRRGAAALGLPTGRRALEAVSAAWRPWRSYAVHHLWSAA